MWQLQWYGFKYNDSLAGIEKVSGWSRFPQLLIALSPVVDRIILSGWSHYPQWLIALSPVVDRIIPSGWAHYPQWLRALSLVVDRILLSWNEFNCILHVFIDT